MFSHRPYFISQATSLIVVLHSEVEHRICYNGLRESFHGGQDISDRK